MIGNRRSRWSAPGKAPLLTLLSGISHDTVRFTIKSGCLPLSLACDICQRKLDILTKESSKNIRRKGTNIHLINVKNIG